MMITSKSVDSTRHRTNDEAFHHFAKRSFDHHTLQWWAVLSSIGLINIAFWVYTYCTLDLEDTTAKTTHPYQYYHLMLSGVYVFVCAYRSFLPRIDLERYCLFDTFLSSIFLGRSAATIAEISFACQISLFLYHLGDVHGHPLTQYLAIALVPLITIAQGFCWCGVVSLNHFYHAVEESIWAVSSIFVAAAMGGFAYYHPDNHSLCRTGVIGCVASLFFFAFMAIVDVPMYIKRWKEHKETAKQYGKKMVHMSSFEGAKDAWERRAVTKSWNVWKEETVWLTGYFSSAVWLSLFLVHVPAP
ncbi:predicted protein [Thalassiosira pseudonana CCMP1335]|jgi:hypothetical protein|uniref:Uncharacterized protein n=1 Tax=Thalassiosira pseudonana TaxID=35128 RepID=B8CD15_THAPS|nr:predicted protein [Thalassiosira pseudonana CCMP1335]EED88390.1 predicted protein [Thalassiosira pseudonana CCMP1335]|eukprot:scaffold2185_cov160-Alexandrium_tamarense.AAC.1